VPQQLIFTSAVRGITPGSSGYCTVARSVEMREGLVSRLEQLSVYQHVQSGVNPMVLSHRILSLRGTIFHVLTRTVDAGLDYTNRTNFISHHVIFQPHELHGACTPADFILYWPGWLSSWDGDPAWTDDQTASLIDVHSTTSLPAENWKGWSVNAENASLLFEANKARDVALVIEPGQESALIYLFAESLLLLNDDRNGKASQWQVPFTTFFQSKDEVTEFRWRGIWPEVNRAKAERGALVLDFRNPSSFPPATGPAAEWASTGIAPKPVLNREITPTTENQPAATEEIASTSIPKSKQKRTVNVSQASRKKIQPEYIQEETEENWQSWFWRWKWVVFVGLAVIAMAIGMAVAMLTAPRIVSSGDQPGQEHPNRPTPATTASVPTFNIQPQNQLQSPLPDKPLVVATNSAPVRTTPPTNLTATQTPLKDGSGTSATANSTTTTPASGQPNQPVAAPAPKVPESFPKGTVYILLRNADTVDLTPIPPSLDAIFKAFKNTADYSASTTGFQDLSKCFCILIPSEDGFVLKLGNKEIAKYASGSLSASPETLYLSAQKGNETVSVMINSVSNTNVLFHLPKALLDLSADDISANNDLKKRLSQFFVYNVLPLSSGNDAERMRLDLQFIITTNKGKSYHPDSGGYTISWAQAVQKAKEDLAHDQATLTNDQMGVGIEAEIGNVTFSSVNAPLTMKNNDVKDFATFLKTPGISNTDSKEPLLVQYAKRILTSLSTTEMTGNLNLSFDPPASNDWASWLKKVPQDLPQKLLPDPVGIHDDQKDAFNSSVKSFCNAWTTTFTSPDSTKLLTLPSKSIVGALGTSANINTDQKRLLDDKDNLDPVRKEAISSAEITVNPIGSSPLQIIQFDSDDYHVVSQSTQGNSK
jgi:hypothetical protein